MRGRRDAALVEINYDSDSGVKIASVIVVEF
jgi:hypothetical protein